VRLLDFRHVAEYPEKIYRIRISYQNIVDESALERGHLSLFSLLGNHRTKIHISINCLQLEVSCSIGSGGLELLDDMAVDSAFLIGIGYETAQGRGCGAAQLNT